MLGARFLCLIVPFVQLRNPPHLAAGPRDAQNLAVVGEGEQPVARHGGGGDARDVEFPDPLTRDQFIGGHAAPLPQRVDAAVVDDRVGVDVGQHADAGGQRCARQGIGPQLAPVFITIGDELPGGIACDHRALAGGGGGDAEHAFLAQTGAFIPDRLAVFGIQRVDFVVLRHHEHRTEGHRRRAAQRAGGLDLPDFLAGSGIQRRHQTEAGGDIDLAVIVTGAAAEDGVLGVAGDGEAVRPAGGATGRVIGMQHAQRVHHIHHAAADDGGAGEASALVGAGDRDAPHLLGVGADGEVAVALVRRAARLRPGLVFLCRRHDHRHRGNRIIHMRARLDMGEDIDAVAGGGGDGLVFVADMRGVGRTAPKAKRQNRRQRQRSAAKQFGRKRRLGHARHP